MNSTHFFFFESFPKNQDWLREAGILVILPSLLSHHHHGVQLAAIRAAGNLALNTGNMKEMEQTVLVLVLLAENKNRYCRNTELLCTLSLTRSDISTQSTHQIDLTLTVG